MKMVLIRISRMLRGWLSLYKKEAGERLEGLIVKLKELSRRPAQIEWKEEITRASSSQLDQSDAQSSVDARSDLFTAEFCNEPLG
jgi:hypothetical protein